MTCRLHHFKSAYNVHTRLQVQLYTCMLVIHVLMRDEKEERKKQAWSNKHTNKAKQHSTPKAILLPEKNEVPRVGLKPTTLMYMYMVSMQYLRVWLC